MRALTLWQPWAWAISHGGKRIENRGWKPPRWIIGERIAIHAGKKFDEEDAFDLLSELDMPDIHDLARGAVVAVATVKGYVESIGESHPQHRWFCGPYGWVLDDVVALERPVPCKGALKLWFLPADVERDVLAQLDGPSGYDLCPGGIDA
jgi:hypothetical protein